MNKLFNYKALDFRISSYLIRYFSKWLPSIDVIKKLSLFSVKGIDDLIKELKKLTKKYPACKYSIEALLRDVTEGREFVLRNNSKGICNNIPKALMHLEKVCKCIPNKKIEALCGPSKQDLYKLKRDGCPPAELVQMDGTMAKALENAMKH